MKLKLIALSFLLVGCTNTHVDLSHSFSDEMNETPDSNYAGLGTDFVTAELEPLLDKYGKDYHKAANICHERYAGPLDQNLDSSTEEGSKILTEYYANLKYCIQEQLNDFITDDWSQPVDYTSGMDKTSHRYKELYATCKENNTIPGEPIDQSSVDLCIYRAY